MAEAKLPVIIVGAGVVGLALGQALQKQGVPFIILERDASPAARRKGWAITLHWALEFIQDCLPTDVLERVEACQVDPEVAANDAGNFLFLNLEDCSVKFKIPLKKRWRVKREKMLSALYQGVEDSVQWGKKVVEIHPPQTGSEKVEVVCEDGSRYPGMIVVGVEGSNSMVRRMLRPDSYHLQQLPVPIRLAGVTVSATPEQAAPLRALDPLLFQGCHPVTGTYLWVSTLETPAVNGTADTEDPRYLFQINLSWPVKSPEDELAANDADRLSYMKKKAQCFTPVLRKAIDDIPSDTEVIEIKLADWECLDWDNLGGKVTLAGDAAHAMTMYRGEAANHGLLDAYYLTKALRKIYDGASQKATIDAYDQEMRERTSAAVRLSRQACIDAHSFDSLNEHSAVLKKRAIPSV